MEVQQALKEKETTDQGSEVQGGPDLVGHDGGKKCQRHQGRGEKRRVYVVEPDIFRDQLNFIWRKVAADGSGSPIVNREIVGLSRPLKPFEGKIKQDQPNQDEKWFPDRVQPRVPSARSRL